MLIDEHKALIKELQSDTLEASRKTEILTKLGDDYTLTQADITATNANLEAVTKDRDHYADMSKKLWLENSAVLTNEPNKNKQNKTELEHQAKRTYQDLMSKF